MRSQRLLTVLLPALLIVLAGGPARADHTAYGGVVGAGVAPAEAGPAWLTIKAPADAVLTFNGVAVAGSGETRAYQTVAIYRGYPYAYEVTAYVVRGKQVIQATERVVVWAGEESKLTFHLPPAPVLLEKPKPVGGKN